MVHLLSEKKLCSSPLGGGATAASGLALIGQNARRRAQPLRPERRRRVVSDCYVSLSNHLFGILRCARQPHDALAVPQPPVVGVGPDARSHSSLSPLCTRSHFEQQRSPLDATTLQSPKLHSVSFGANQGSGRSCGRAVVRACLVVMGGTRHGPTLNATLRDTRLVRRKHVPRSCLNGAQQ